MISDIVIGIMTPERATFAENSKETPVMSFAAQVSGGKQSVITIQILCRHAAKVTVTGGDVKQSKL